MNVEMKEKFEEAIFYAFQAEMFLDYSYKLSESIPEIKQYFNLLDKDRLRNYKDRILDQIEAYDS